MAYDTASPPVIISEPLGSGPTVWQYTSTDSAGTIAASGYFSNGAYLGMAAGDVIFLVNSTTGVVITASMLSSASIGITSPTVANTPILIGQSYSGSSRTSVNATGDASYITIASATVPGGTMGLNSKLVIIEDWDIPNSTSTKTMSIDVGGSNVSALALGTGQVGFKGMHEFQNLNSLTSQKTANAISYALFATNARLATSIDTTADFNVDFKCKWSAAASAETISLLGYSIWHHPGS